MTMAVRKESQALINEIEQRNNDLIGENYSRTLQQMLDIERRLSEQQREMVAKAHQDGQRAFDQLESPSAIQALEEQFNRKIRALEQDLESS